MANQVVFVMQDVTLHRSLGKQTSQFGDVFESVEGVTLLPGETFPLNDLSEVQQEAAKSGGIPAVEVMTEAQAKAKLEEVSKLRSMLSGNANINFNAMAFTGPDANDGSHSDHEVPDDVRQENLANEAAADEPSAPETKSGKSTRKVEGDDASTGTLEEK